LKFGLDLDRLLSLSPFINSSQKQHHRPTLQGKDLTLSWYKARKWDCQSIRKGDYDGLTIHYLRLFGLQV